MKIVSVNRVHTANSNEVAFNVQDPISPEVLRTAKLPNGFKVNFVEATVIRCTVTSGMGMRFNKKAISELHDAFSLADKAAKDAVERAARERQNTLDQIAKDADLPLD
ncbi:hypothetical protein [Variovorax sp. PAMC26660]|uniref:hypothetical protein n=1 Tax=Variovorax sp. PAMC26660 TaxID=2762322 RepID=UPI00164D35E1|nr:hypothetical protein [Variovorax sp. PAMC26660]QNK66104.1 hypothetical protein H7F35_23275 [Variovorax sp. PAMC26660]